MDTIQNGLILYKQKRQHNDIFRKIIENKFGVDAGNISIVDLAYIESCGGLYGPCAKRMSKLVKLKPGKYKVKVQIDDCWVDSVKEEFILYTTGK